MASYAADRIVVFDSREQAERPGFMGGKPTHAQVERLYRIPRATQVDQVVSEAVWFAEGSDGESGIPILVLACIRGRSCWGITRADCPSVMAPMTDPIWMGIGTCVSCTTLGRFDLMT